jgi:predicted permease
MLVGLWRDLGHALRSLSKARAFTIVCVVSLGIGMVPVFAIPYASRLTMMEPAGVNTDGLVELVTTSVGPHSATARWSYPDYVDLRDANTGITLIGWIGGENDITFEGTGDTKMHVSTMFVPAHYFKTLGLVMARGAGFDESADDPLATTPVVVVNYNFWRNHLGADPDIVGKTITMDGVPNVVVGIAPEHFGGHYGFGASAWDLYAPLERHPRLIAGGKPGDSYRADRSREWLGIHGRLPPGMSVEQASAAVAAVTARLAKAHPETNEFRAGVAAAYDPLGVLERSQLRMLKLVASTLTGMVLLVVSLNISGMMQVRSAMRERELSIRQAIGASRARLAQYLLSEAIVLACAGGALASLVLVNLPSIISRVAGQPIPPEFQDALKIDLPTFAILLGLCLLTSLVFGWLPAMRFSRPVIVSSLKDDAGGGGMRVGKVHRVTAALQVAIAVPLLVMSGQSLDRMRATTFNSLGFDADLLYAAPLKLDRLTIDQAGAAIRKAAATLRAADGVASVTVADGLPLDFRGREMQVSLKVDANTAPRFISAQVTRTGDGYLGTMGIPLVRGRQFTAEDRDGSEPVTIVSKPLADRLAPDGDVIGKQLLFGPDPKTQKTLTIVGVTADFPTSQMSTWREQLLVPLAQYPGVSWDAVPVVDDLGTSAQVMVIARSVPGEDAKKMTATLENIAKELNPDFQTYSVVTGVWLRHKSMDDFLTQSAVSAIAGGVILMLAALGIYGVVGLMVATRTREIAVRAALGASRRRLLGMIVFDVVRLVLPGTVIGMLLTVVLNRLNAENMGVALTDVEPVAYILGALIAVLVAVIAALAPARRAASVHPMIAMRST